MPEPTFEEIRERVIGYIKERRAHLDSSFQVPHLEAHIEDHLRRTYGERAKDDYADLFNDVLWDLMTRGVIAPYNRRNRSHGFLHVTKYGQQCIEQGRDLVYDPAGFLKGVLASVPKLDMVAKTYLEESISAFNKDLLLSSTITLGTASERLVILLIAAYAAALQPAARPTFEKKIAGSWISTQFEEFEESLGFKITSGAVPDEYEADFRTCVKPLFDLYRQNRNLAGHPTGLVIDKEILRAHLQAFAPYAQRLYKLLAFFEAKKDGL